MALTPGLNSFREDAPGRGRRAGTSVPLNTNIAATPRLRPEARATDTYMRPAQAQGGGALAQIADALKGLNPALERFAAVQQATEYDDVPGEVSRRQLEAGSPAAFSDRLKSDPFFQGKLARRLGAGQLGLNVADQTVREIQEAYATGKFDRDSGDLDGFVNTFIQRDLETYGSTDPNFAAEYQRRVMQGVGQLRGAQTQYAAGKAVDDQNQLVYGTFQARVNGGIDSDQSPEQIYAAIRQDMQTNKAIANKPFSEQEQILTQYLSRLGAEIEANPARAEKLYAVAQVIANGDRVGADGTKLGALKDSTTVGDKVIAALGGVERQYGAVRERGSTEARFEFQKQAMDGTLDEAKLKEFYDNPANKRSMSDEQYLSLRRMSLTKKAENEKAYAKAVAEQAEKDQVSILTSQTLDAGNKGDLAFVQDAEITGANGEPKVITRKQRIDAAIAEREKYSSWLADKEAASGQFTPQQVEDRKFANDAEWFSTNGQVNPQWETILKEGAISGNSVMAGKPLPPALVKGFDIYRKLNQAAPQLLHAMTDESARNQFETARVLRELGGLSDQDALASAVAFNRDVAQMDSVTARQRFETVDTAIRGRMQGNWLYRNTWGAAFGDASTPTFDNTEAVSVDIQKLAQIYARRGIPVDAAITEAAKQTMKSYMVVNGTAVKVNDRVVPPNFPKMAETYLKGFIELNGAKLHREYDDITVMPDMNASDRWRVVDKKTLVPVTNDADSVITMGDLGTLMQARRDKAAKQASESNERIQNYRETQRGKTPTVPFTTPPARKQ